MRIFFIGDTAFPDSMGGSHRYTYELANRLANKGHEVIIIIPKKNKNSQSYEFINKILYIRYTRKSGMLGMVSYVVGTFRCLNKLLKEGLIPDHVEIYWPLSMLGFRIFQVLNGIKCYQSYTFHGPWSFETAAELRGIMRKIARYILVPLERMLIHGADHYITLSNYMRNMLCDNIRVTNVLNVSVIPGGVDTKRFNISANTSRIASRERLNIPIDAKIYITVRRLRKRMGLEALIQAFSDFSKNNPDVYLIVAGVGPIAHELHAIVDILKIEKYVKLIGFVSDEDLPYFYRAADFFVLPSESLEGFGLVIAECLASGTPVLGTNIGAIPEVLYELNPNLIMDGAGYSSILTILNRSVDFKINSWNCVEYAVRFDWDEVVKRRNEIYNYDCAIRI